MAQNFNDPLYAMRHSLAHIMATAIQQLWPTAQFGVGPVIDNGFYYDFLIPDQPLSEQHFKQIEAAMRKIIRNNDEFSKSEESIEVATAWAKDTNQPLKLELLNDLKRSGTTQAQDIPSELLGTETDQQSQVNTVSFYTNGSFKDLCRGPHVKSTGEVGAFKLMRISGAYWRGNEKNVQLQRIYGVAFPTSEDLKAHLTMLEEAQKRDHRKLGVELDLFVFSDLVGSGLPMFTPRGTVIREELQAYSNSLRIQHRFERVYIPHIAKRDLYEKSGHWDKYGDQLFLVRSQETKDELVMKAMNCPHHTRIYASKPRSYKDLPIRYFETTAVYRDEKSGELGGLNRVRAITQDDSHVFCRNDQIEVEIQKLLSCAQELYKTVGMDLRVRLSYRDDGPGYLGASELWVSAEAQLKKAVLAQHMEFFEQPGEAAFYGPKIDFMATDAIGREHQVATVQLDFIQPERFELQYTTEDGTPDQPVMIHSALLGSVERFMSVYIEHTAGRFPVWVAPEQLRIITLNQEPATVEFAQGLEERGLNVGIRVTMDNNNQSVGKKIRSAELYKIPYTVVVGPQEISSGSFTPRIRADLLTSPDATPKNVSIDELLHAIQFEAATRVSTTTIIK